MVSSLRFDRLKDSSLSRYALSGVAVYIIDITLFYVLNWYDPERYATWTVAGRLAGAAAGFVLHNGFSFAGAKADSKTRMAARYGVLLIVNAALSVLLLRLAVEALGLDSRLARPVIDVIVIALAFIVSRGWVFRMAQS